MKLSGFLPCVSLVLVLSLAIPAGADNIDAINYYNKAVELAYQGEYTQALTEIDRALQENQNFTLAWVTRAGILNNREQFEEGLAASDRAIELEPNNSYAWINRATALNGLGRYQESIAASDRALSIDPESEEARRNRQAAMDMLPGAEGTPGAGLPAASAVAACAGMMGMLFLFRKR